MRIIMAGSSELDNIIREKEPKANLLIAKIMCAAAALYLILWWLFQIGFFAGSNVLIHSATLGGALITIISAVLCFRKKGQGRWIKYMLLEVCLICVFMINIMTGFKMWMFYAVPLMLSCRYFNKRLTVATSVFSAALVAVSAFVNAYIMPAFVYMDLNTVSYNKPVTLAVDGFIFRAVAASDLDNRQIFLNSLKLAALPNIIMIIGLTIVALYVISYTQALMIEVNMAARREAELEVEMADSRARIMISQIQPHFLFNALTAIMAIDGNPDETVEAIGQFGKYLRENLNVLTTESKVSFSKEMQHVMRYVSLEQLRFDDRINVEYDIPVKNFALPALTIQMLVENAIKHGICKKMEGGSVLVRSAETEDEFLVIVKDNGQGFDTSLPVDEKKHIGLANIRARLKQYCGGHLEISSVPGEGTEAIVHIPKEREGDKYDGDRS